MSDVDVMPAAVAPDDEELRRRQSAQLPIPNAIPPAMPPAPTAAPQAQSPAPMPQTMPPAASAPQAAPAPVKTPPAMPAAQVGPAQQRLQDLTAQGPPKLPFWKQALDVIGSIHPIGREIEANIPGSPQNYSAKMNQAEERAKTEQGLEGGRQNQQKNAQQMQTQAQESGMVDVPGHPELGKVEAKSLPAIIKQIEANEGKTDTADINATSRKDVEQMKIDAKPAMAQGLKMGVLKPDIVAQIGPMPEDAEGQKKWGEEYDKLAANSGQRQTGIGTLAKMRALDWATKYEPALIPHFLQALGGDVGAGGLPPGAAQIPAGMPTDEQGKPIGTALPGAPTPTTRSQGQMAEKVLDRIPDVRKEIESLKTYLGPGEGRLNVGFLLGKVGSTGDPQKDRALSTLRTDIGLMASAASRFHINSVKAMENMESLANAGKDSAPALQGAIDGIEKWAKDAANQGRGRPVGQNAAPERPKGVPEGAKWDSATRHWIL